MARQKHRFTLVFASVVLLWMWSCGNKLESGHFQRVGTEGWAYADTIIFAPDSTLGVEPCDVAVAIRHSNGYEYANIWVELTTTRQDTIIRDTANLRLADDFGHWYGTGIGVGYQKMDTLLNNIPIDLSQPIMLRHIMRADTLPGIEQAGIILYRKSNLDN